MHGKNYKKIKKIFEFNTKFSMYSLIYKVVRIKLKHLIWLKMTLKIIGDMKATHFYNHKDPPFDMKHQLMSADSVPVVKIDLK